MSGDGLAVPFARRLWLYLFVGLVLLFLLVPIFIVVPMSFSSSNYLEFPPATLSTRWYKVLLASPEWMRAARTSLLVAVLATLVSVPVGVAAAYGLSRSRSWPGTLVHFVLILPQAIPVILVAIGVFFLYIRIGAVNSLGGIVAAHAALCLPFVIITTVAGLKSFDFDQEDAARSLGATRLRAFLDVTAPQIRISIIASAIFCFITSFDEVVIGLFIAGGENTLLTRLMFLALRDQLDPVIAALSSIMIAVSIVAFGFSACLRRQP